MSKYAMAWARGQQPGDAAAKLVLILVADQSAGDSGCRVYDDEFLAETGLGVEGLNAAVQLLTEVGLLTAQPWKWPSKRAQTVYSLHIPRTWGSRTAGPPPRGNSSWSDSPTAVYRFYDEAGELLYVGIADDPPARFKQHAAKQEWWGEVATREIVWCDSRADANRDEAIAIASERPRYNLRERTWDSCGRIDPPG